MRRSLERLVRSMAAEALDGADGTPADLVLGVDDLELASLHQASVVANRPESARARPACAPETYPARAVKRATLVIRNL